MDTALVGVFEDDRLLHHTRTSCKQIGGEEWELGDVSWWVSEPATATHVVIELPSGKAVRRVFALPFVLTPWSDANLSGV